MHIEKGRHYHNSLMNEGRSVHTRILPSVEEAKRMRGGWGHGTSTTQMKLNYMK
jgi:hypothetical protein